MNVIGQTYQDVLLQILIISIITTHIAHLLACVGQLDFMYLVGGSKVD